MKFVKSNCEFCKIVKTPKKSDQFIIELDASIVLMHPNQVYKGRVLLIAKKHPKTFPEIEREMFSKLNDELILVSKAIKKAFSPDLINYASLGNQIEHFHYHIIPRYSSEQNWRTPPWPYDKNFNTSKIEKQRVKTIIQIEINKLINK